MTSLLEKALIIGFGLSMAIIVLPIINQYIEQVIIYDQNRAKINEFIDMIETVNDGITAIENKNELNFNDSIEIVEGTKILINESYIHYSLSIGDEIGRAHV